MSVCVWSCRIWFDSESGQINDGKLVLTAFLLDFQQYRDTMTVWRTSRRTYSCRWEKHLAGFPQLCVVDRWPATPKRARLSQGCLKFAAVIVAHMCSVTVDFIVFSFLSKFVLSIWMLYPCSLFLLTPHLLPA